MSENDAARIARERELMAEMGLTPEDYRAAGVPLADDGLLQRMVPGWAEYKQACRARNEQIAAAADEWHKRVAQRKEFYAANKVLIAQWDAYVNAANEHMRAMKAVPVPQAPSKA